MNKKIQDLTESINAKYGKKVCMTGEELMKRIDLVKRLLTRQGILFNMHSNALYMESLFEDETEEQLLQTLFSTLVDLCSYYNLMQERIKLGDK